MGILDGVLKGYTNAVLGPAPTDVGGAYAKLQTELNSKYEKNKQAFEADPNNAGKTYQMPDALQRWNDQISGMITSGDPVLQKAGIEQMTDYYKRATESNTVAPANSVKEYQYAQSQGYQGSYQDWVKEKAAAGRSSVNVSVNSGEKPISIDDLQKLILPNGQQVPAGTTYNQLPALGATVVRNEQQTARGTSVDSVAGALNEIADAAETGGIPDPITGNANKMRYSGGIGGAVADAALNTLGAKGTPQDAALSSASSRLGSNMVKLMSGASATDQEYERIMSQLPVPGQPRELFEANYKATVKNYQDMAKRARANGVVVEDIDIKPLGRAKTNNAVPQALRKRIESGDKAVKEIVQKAGNKAQEHVSKGGIKFTVE